MLMINVSEDTKRVINDAYNQLRSIMPWLGRDVKIGFGSWEYSHSPGRHTTFNIWSKDHFIAHDRPIEEWDDFIRKYRILFRDFKTQVPF